MEKELQEQIELLEDKCLAQEKQILELKSELERSKYSLAQFQFQGAAQQSAAQDYYRYGVGQGFFTENGARKK